MASTYENVLFDRVLTGVETLLEAEFVGTKVYIAEEPDGALARKSIRLWHEPTEFLSRAAGAKATAYPIEVIVAQKEGGGGKRNFKDQRREHATRAMRVLDDNSHYVLSNGTYQWGNGFTDELEKTDEGMRFVFTVSVTETL